MLFSESFVFSSQHYYYYYFYSFETSNEPICGLLSSIRSYIDCIQPLSSDGYCDERALEVLEPIKAETVNVYSDVKCQS